MIPRDLAIMLDADTRHFFDSLPSGRQRRYVEPIIQARELETREYRVARAIQMMRERREQ